MALGYYVAETKIQSKQEIGLCIDGRFIYERSVYE